MALVKSLTGSGNAGLSAQAIVGFVSTAQTASGASQGAQSLPTSIVEYTTSTSNYGPTLPADAAPGDTYTVFNNTANTIKVWPASGYKLNGGTTDAALSLTTLKVASFTSLGNGNWAYNLTA
jgi:hypothetical protein